MKAMITREAMLTFDREEEFLHWSTVATWTQGQTIVEIIMEEYEINDYNV